MKIAYVHILPLEYYPPATNTLIALAEKPGVELVAWSSDNLKQRVPFAHKDVRIERPKFVQVTNHPAKRMMDWVLWNWKCARGLKALAPDAVISVEPHSALAPWFYYQLMGGKARLFIHHHEYYAPQDYLRQGMRFVRIAHKLEKRDLLQRAEWISQTNGNRLQFMQKDNPGLPAEKFKIWPNYPPRHWRRPRTRHPSSPLRVVYLGSASFHDTYIREAVEWVARRPNQVELVISGYNIADDVWNWLREHQWPNVKLHPDGWSYDELPEKLAEFDVGLILYRCNTINFIYNAPNKLFEYWACGLEVWYPPEMKQITELSQKADVPPLQLVDFQSLNRLEPVRKSSPDGNFTSEYSCESALTPLLEQLR